jgi:hypothetical protein
VTTKSDFGALSQFQVTSRYTYAGRDGNFDKIVIGTTQKFVKPVEGRDGETGLPFKIKDCDLRHWEGTGILLFDRAKGQPVTQEMNLRLAGRLTIEIGGQDTIVDLAQTQKITIKTTDTRPGK